MIIDQLPTVGTPSLTDETVTEQGQNLFKVTWQRLLNLFKGNTTLSELTNDAGFVNASGAAAAAPVQSVNGKTGAVVVNDVGTISMSASWSGSDPYTQTVTVSGATVTANSKVDIQPDASTLAQLINDGVSALFIVNNNGTLTAYAVGAAPSSALTLQCVVTEVVL